ncbi:CoA transferase [Bordetella petrii]|nr:CoA transferase [Bordetella petrii]
MSNATTDGTGGPLSGVRVLDLTINVLGPVATQILGDMGADVIKVEPPQGDPMRDSGHGRNPRMSAFFLNMNRNKRSVVLDLKKSSGRDALFQLAEGADVLVHSMRQRAAVRLGLDYADLAARYPRLIYASAPGYDPGGPYRDRPAYDDVIQGETGLADMVRLATGTPGYLPTVIADKTCGVYLASAIGMALYSRERTGKGQQVQVPMFESMLSFNLIEHLWSGTFGDPHGLGYVRALSPHRRPYATQDGFICVLAVNDEQWRRLLAALGLKEAMADPKYATLTERTRNINDLYAMVAQAISTHSTADLGKLFDQADIPHGPMNRLEDLFSNDHLAHTGFFQRYEHPTEGTVVTTAVPQRFSETPAGFRLPPPRLGQHTASVLREAGLAETAIAELQA